ncbi:MAG TPA: S24/S26 family peptidase [Polyangiaceae bacterium]|nr:S24/S26 family peptidase [Polyangiaceae bacterium]
MSDAPVVDALVEALAGGRAVTLRALGHSMEPTIPPGSVVRVEPCAERSLRWGDVAACVRPDGGLALHRVVARDAAGRVRTWGDAMRRPDDWAPRVVGKVVVVPERPRRSWWFRLKGRLRVVRHLAWGPLLGCR